MSAPFPGTPAGQPLPGGPRATGRLSRSLGALARWLVTLAISLLGLLAVTFVIGRMVPIDPVMAVLGDRASASAYAAAKASLGLDQPLYVQFGIYVRVVPGHAPEIEDAPPPLTWHAILGVLPILVIFGLVFGGIYGVKRFSPGRFPSAKAAAQD